MVGGHVWSSALYLSRFLFANRALLDGKDVLELGCGMALPSILCAHFARQVVATDRTASVLRNVEENVNEFHPRLSTKLTTRMLDLGAPGHIPHHPCADVILFSEVIYNVGVARALPPILQVLLRRPHSVAYGIQPTTTRVGLDAFFEQLQRTTIDWSEHPLGPELTDGTENSALQCKLYKFWLRPAESDEATDEGLLLLEPLFASEE
jgi:SAM-dependent methyltransferase